MSVEYAVRKCTYVVPCSRLRTVSIHMVGEPTFFTKTDRCFRYQIAISVERREMRRPPHSLMESQHPIPYSPYPPCAMEGLSLACIRDACVAHGRTFRTALRFAVSTLCAVSRRADFALHAMLGTGVRFPPGLGPAGSLGSPTAREGVTDA